jgi:hypothetical protein
MAAYNRKESDEQSSAKPNQGQPKPAEGEQGEAVKRSQLSHFLAQRGSSCCLSQIAKVRTSAVFIEPAQLKVTDPLDASCFKRSIFGLVKALNSTPPEVVRL